MLRILIADDEIETRNAMACSIKWEENGLMLDGLADNGLSAYDMIVEKKPDIALIDINMPGMNGLEVIDKCKNNSELNTSFIIISGYDDFSYAQEAIHLGVEEYLLKPFKKSDLLEAINKAVLNIKSLNISNNTNAVHNFFDSYNKIINQNSNQSNITYPVEFEKIFIMNLKSGNYEKAEEALNCMLKIIDNDSNMTSTALNYTMILYLEMNRTLMEFGMTLPDDTIKNLSLDNNIIISFKDILKTTFKTVFDMLHKNSKMNPCVYRAIQYIKENYRENPTLEEIAHAAYVSPAYLSGKFTQSTGMRLNEYIHKIKIENAKELMKDSKYKLYEIAEIVGYKEVKYFSNVFRKTTGYTPSQYRSLVLTENLEDELQ